MSPKVLPAARCMGSSANAFSAMSGGSLDITEANSADELCFEKKTKSPVSIFPDVFYFCHEAKLFVLLKHY